MKQSKTEHPYSIKTTVTPINLSEDAGSPGISKQSPFPPAPWNLLLSRSPASGTVSHTDKVPSPWNAPSYVHCFP